MKLMNLLRLFFHILIVSSLLVSCNDEKSNSEFLSNLDANDQSQADSNDDSDVGTTPIISSIAIPASDVYSNGQVLNFDLVFDQDISVSGSPILNLSIGRYSKAASCSVFNGSRLRCSYTISDTGSQPDLDFDGIAYDSFDLNGASILGSVGSKTADMNFTAPDLSGIKVHYSNFTNWLDANDSSTLFASSDCTTTISDGDSVECWVDKKSGAQATSSGTRRPVYSANGGANGSGKVFFERDHVEYPTPVTINSNYTVIAIYDVTAYSTLNYLIGSVSSSTNGIGFGLGGTWTGGDAGDGLYQISRNSGVIKTMASNFEPSLNTWGIASYTNQKIFQGNSEAAPYIK